MKKDDLIVNAVQKAESDFFIKVVEKILGRPFIKEDAKDFHIIRADHLGRTFIQYKDVMCGEIKADYSKMTWEFIPETLK